MSSAFCSHRLASQGLVLQMLAGPVIAASALAWNTWPTGGLTIVSTGAAILAFAFSLLAASLDRPTNRPARRALWGGVGLQIAAIVIPGIRWSSIQGDETASVFAGEGLGFIVLGLAIYTWVHARIFPDASDSAVTSTRLSRLQVLPFVVGLCGLAFLGMAKLGHLDIRMYAFFYLVVGIFSPLFPLLLFRVIRKLPPQIDLNMEKRWLTAVGAFKIVVGTAIAGACLFVSLQSWRSWSAIPGEAAVNSLVASVVAGVSLCWAVVGGHDLATRQVHWPKRLLYALALGGVFWLSVNGVSRAVVPSRLDARTDKEAVTVVTKSENRSTPAPQASTSSHNALTSDATSVGLAFSIDGTRLAAIKENGSIDLWDVASNKRLKTIDQAAGTVVKFSPDDTSVLALTSDRTEIAIWDTATGERTKSLKCENPVDVFDVSLDGQTVVTIEGRQVRRVDTSSGKMTTVHQCEESILCLSISPTGNGTNVSCGNKILAVPLDLQSIATVAEWSGPSDKSSIGAMTKIVQSLDGRWLYSSGSHNGAHRWKQDELRYDQKIPAIDFTVATMALSPDSKWLALAAKDQPDIYIFDTWKLGQARHFRGQQEPVVALAFDPKSERLASSTRDQSIRFWPVVGR